MTCQCRPRFQDGRIDRVIRLMDAATLVATRKAAAILLAQAENLVRDMRDEAELAAQDEAPGPAV